MVTEQENQEKIARMLQDADIVKEWKKFERYVIKCRPKGRMIIFF